MRHAFERIDPRMQKHSVNKDPKRRAALLVKILNSLRRSVNERVGQRRAVSEVRKQQQPPAAP